MLQILDLDGDQPLEALDGATAALLVSSSQNDARSAYALLAKIKAQGVPVGMALPERKIPRQPPSRHNFGLSYEGMFYIAATEVTNEQLIQESLIQLVLTMRGERVMRPDVGCGATTLVFENNDSVLSNLLRAEVQGTIARFEPRVHLQDIIVERSDSEIIVTLVYIIIATRRPGSVSVALPTP